MKSCGKDSSIYIEEVLSKDVSFGFNAKSEKVEDLIKAEVIDPTKVVKNALKYAASVAGIVLISEALVTDAIDDEEEAS